MKTTHAIRCTVGLLALSIAGAVSAQTPPADFPAERARPLTCSDFGWHADMRSKHPRVIDQCQEVVSAEGASWARLEARFVEFKSDGTVVFSIRDKHDRVIEEMLFEPAAGQVAYIDDTPTPFADLSTSHTINLYVAENQYGWSTRPVITERFTRYAPYQTTVQTEIETSTSDTTSDMTAAGEYDAEAADQVAVNDSPEPMPTRLPDTAGLLPWTALAGSILLFAAFTLRLARKR